MDINKIITKDITPLSNTERYLAWIGEFHRRLAQGNVELMGETAELIKPARIEPAVVVDPVSVGIVRYLRKGGAK